MVSFLAFFVVDTIMHNYCVEQYELLNPRRRCESEPEKTREYDELMHFVMAEIDMWTSQKKVNQVTVHFRDLDSGNVFTIGANERFAPASLLKVPIMISLLNYAQNHPDVMETMITIDPAYLEGQNILDPEKTLIAGKQYSVKEIMRRMIVYSDNASKNVLHTHMEKLVPGSTDQTFVDLGIALQNPDGSSYITIKSYAGMLRALFNASYLDRKHSEEALELLTQTDFAEGLESGIPDNMKIAHKFGYLDISPQEQQLHDCGIVYYPGTPYLLCIMTRGSNPDLNIEVISTISKTVFAEIDARAKN